MWPAALVPRLIAESSRTERSIRLKRIAAASMVAGSLLTRQGWVQAGRASARNPVVALDPSGVERLNYAVASRRLVPSSNNAPMPSPVSKRVKRVEGSGAGIDGDPSNLSCR